MSEEQVLPELNLPPNNHGYPDCDCDLVGGDQTCTIQPPYMSGPERWKMALKQREDELRTALASLAQSEAERERLQEANDVITRVAAATIERAAAAEGELARERELHRWRDCKQEMPQEYGEYLLWWVGIDASEGFTPYASVEDFCLERGRFVASSSAHHITHWRPLPEPPALLGDKSKPVAATSKRESKQDG